MGGSDKKLGTITETQQEQPVADQATETPIIAAGKLNRAFDTLRRSQEAAQQDTRSQFCERFLGRLTAHMSFFDSNEAGHSKAADSKGKKASKVAGGVMSAVGGFFGLGVIGEAVKAAGGAVADEVTASRRDRVLQQLGPAQVKHLEEFIGHVYDAYSEEIRILEEVAPQSYSASDLAKSMADTMIATIAKGKGVMEDTAKVAEVFEKAFGDKYLELYNERAGTKHKDLESLEKAHYEKHPIPEDIAARIQAEKEAEYRRYKQETARAEFRNPNDGAPNTEAHIRTSQMLSEQQAGAQLDELDMRRPCSLVANEHSISSKRLPQELAQGVA